MNKGYCFELTIAYDKPSRCNVIFDKKEWAGDSVFLVKRGEEFFKLDSIQVSDLYRRKQLANAMMLITIECTDLKPVLGEIFSPEGRAWVNQPNRPW
jgi:hypothetical protein